jgi:hypothetical protein
MKGFFGTWNRVSRERSTIPKLTSANMTELADATSVRFGTINAIFVQAFHRSIAFPAIQEEGRKLLRCNKLRR